MRVGEVKYKYKLDGNVVTLYRSEIGMCSFFSFEAKSAAWMERRRREVKSSVEKHTNI